MARDLGVPISTVFAAFSLALVVSALLGPKAGRAIDHWGGRPVLMGTSLVFAAGLTALGGARDVLGLFAAWVVMGVGMGSGLYEAAFAALVRLHGRGARSAITGITLIAGFASTVGWPLSTLFEAEFGWRGACFAWAVLHLVLGLPLNALLPKAAPVVDRATQPGQDGSAKEEGGSWRAALVLSFVFAATWFISTAMAAHLPRLLTTAGVSSHAAVLVGMLIGPAQVGARLLEFGFLQKLHPLLSARLAAALHPLGVALFAAFGVPAAALFGILHGAGNGILTIAKGTLPLVIFGPHGYGHRQGVLMVPARIAQALAPWLFGLALDAWAEAALGLSAAIGSLAFLALFLLPEPASSTEKSTAKGLAP
jgi:predicted MFS family arabinose efflux permease